MIRTLLLALILALSPVQSSAQAIYAENQIPARGVEVQYTVSFNNPISHLYDVQMSIRGIRDQSVSVSLPAWMPGAYTIREFARNVQEFRAANQRGQSLSWEQTDKQTWRVTKQAADDVTVR
jgi:predicted metalloprotease with PDZ domain